MASENQNLKTNNLEERPSFLSFWQKYLLYKIFVLLVFILHMVLHIKPLALKPKVLPTSIISANPHYHYHRPLAVARRPPSNCGFIVTAVPALHTALYCYNVLHYIFTLHYAALHCTTLRCTVL